MSSQTNKKKFLMDTPVGGLIIIREADCVTEVKFALADMENFYPSPPNDVATELNAYFNNAIHRINLPTKTAGTEFQQRVWRALCEIPSGRTLTYGALAAKINSSPRAVGQACRKNPLPVIVPCHRIVSANGMVGYAGETEGELPSIKQWLLQHEQQNH